MRKPWYKSATIRGALVAGVSALLSPEVLAVLPSKYANAGIVLGAVASAIGLRRSIPERF